MHDPSAARRACRPGREQSPSPRSDQPAGIEHYLGFAAIEKDAEDVLLANYRAHESGPKIQTPLPSRKSFGDNSIDGP
jgi:hypothetical protein